MLLRTYVQRKRCNSVECVRWRPCSPQNTSAPTNTAQLAGATANLSCRWQTSPLGMHSPAGSGFSKTTPVERANYGLWRTYSDLLGALAHVCQLARIQHESPSLRRALVPHPASLPLSFKECLKFVTVARWSPMRSLERIERAQHLGDFGRLIRHFNTPSIAFAAAPSSCASGQFSSPCHYLRDHFAGPNRGYTARNPSISLSTKTSCRREGWLHFHFSTPSIAFAAAASARPSGGRTRPASCWPSYRGMRGTGRSSEEADAQQKLRTECN